MCSLGFLNESLYLVTYVAPHDVVMLSHWLRHYRESIGVKSNRISVYIDAGRNATAAVGMRDAIGKSGALQAHVILVNLTFTSKVLLDTINRHVATLPPSAYLIWADIDEFYTFPCNMAEQLAQHDIFCAGEQQNQPACTI